MEEASLVFADRADAGRHLGKRLGSLRHEDVIIAGLPRGGVPVAREVARILGAPLDVVMVRKLGVPIQPELAMGAIGENEVRILNPEVIRRAHITAEELAEVEGRERSELNRRAALFRGDRPRLALAGRVVVIVDDGIATGSTARAACEVVRAQHARRVVLAVPVAPSGWRSDLRAVADDLIAVRTPTWFGAVGQYYRDFSQTQDAEVIECLQAGVRPQPPPQ